MKITRTLLVGATLATVAVGGVAGAGLASADTSRPSSNSETSLADKIAGKFNLNKSDVQKVFDEDHQARLAERQTEQKQALADAVTAGKLTQAQADHITSVLNEIDSLHGTTPPDKLSDDVKNQIKQKLDDLHDWAKDNNIDMHYVMPGHGGPGGHKGMMGDSDHRTDLSN